MTAEPSVNTIKYIGSKPARHYRGTSVYIQEFAATEGRALLCTWEIGDFEYSKAPAAEGITRKCVTLLCPQILLSGSRPLTERDIARIKDMIQQAERGR